MKKLNKISPDDYVFEEETINALKELGDVLLRIRKRLIQEGKITVINGKIVEIPNEE